VLTRAYPAVDAPAASQKSTQSPAAPRRASDPL